MSSPRRDVSDPLGADAGADALVGSAVAALTLALLNGETDPDTDLPERAQRRVAHTVAALRAAREDRP